MKSPFLSEYIILYIYVFLYCNVYVYSTLSLEMLLGGDLWCLSFPFFFSSSPPPKPLTHCRLLYFTIASFFSPLPRPRRGPEGGPGFGPGDGPGSVSRTDQAARGSWKIHLWTSLWVWWVLRKGDSQEWSSPRSKGPRVAKFQEIVDKSGQEWPISRT